MAENKQTILRTEHLKAFYLLEVQGTQKTVKAVNDVDLQIYENEIYGIAGESGCGKTTTSRCILRAIDPTSGEICFHQEDGSVIDVAAWKFDGQRGKAQLRRLPDQLHVHSQAGVARVVEIAFPGFDDESTGVPGIAAVGETAGVQRMDEFDAAEIEGVAGGAPGARRRSETGTPETVATAANVRRALDALHQAISRDDLLLVVLIGHGTFDGVDAKFNLVGPDLESAEWSALLNPIPGRVVLVNTTSASSPFLERVGGPRRIVITASPSSIRVRVGCTRV